MTVPTVACTNCGKNFTTDDLRGTSCKYCGTLLAHHARAQQQVAVLNQMMADRNGNGIPDAYEGLVANAQANAMNQAFGVVPHGQPMSAMMGGPMMGGPVMGGPMMGGPMMGGPMMGGPMMGPGMHIQAANMQVAQAVTKTVSTITIIVVASIAFVTLLVMGIAVAVFVMAR